ncbi:MAG: hypothetical protein QOG26_761, partial [Solirubrobacterales bacterium]|nr:hypothetical protein [Solirubrobacterales bacterium]
GDVSLPILSPYRTPAYNRQIHGASQSRHMQADATDFAKALVDKLGRSRFMAAANRIFANGGVGVYPWGAVHVDSRGWRARWSSW